MGSVDLPRRRSRWCVAAALCTFGCAGEPARPSAWPVVAAPPGATAAMAARYRVLAEQVDAARSMLSRVTAASAACRLAAKSGPCEAAVEDAGRAVNELHQLLTSMRHVCKSEDADVQALERLSNEQVDFAGERLDAASGELSGIVGKTFDDARERADRENPVPPPHYHCHHHW